VTTLIPAGVDVTVTPPRPLALTVSVAVCGGGGAGATGATVRLAVSVAPPYVAEIVTPVDVLTDPVETLNPALVAPAATVTLAGTVAAGLLLDKLTTAPPAGAPLVSVTVPCALEPDDTVAGLIETACRLAGADGGVTVSVAVLVDPLYDAVIVTTVLADTAVVAIVNEPAKPFSGMVTLAGTDATAALLLDSPTTAPPNGAPTLSTTLPLDGLDPTTDDGCVDIVESVAGGGGACGVKLRTADHAPATPAVLIPRTRQNCVTVASPDVT